MGQGSVVAKGSDARARAGRATFGLPTRFQRYLHTLIGHVIFDFDATSDLYAKTLLGLDLGVPFA